MAPTSRKAITSVTPNETPAHQVRFAPHLFNELISDKGYDVWHDKALQCPCSVKNAGQPLPNCDNCLGTAWFFVNRSETRMAVQGMKADVRFENWTRDTAGMARVTSRAVDKLAFMDRIILKDVEGYYNEILRTKVKNGRKVLYTMYEVIEVESIYMFVEAKQKLKELKLDVDYTVDNNITSMITLSEALSATITDEATITMRYRHLQTYHIIDMNRDIVKVRTKGCNLPGEQLKEMPINGMARKSHYLFDNLRSDTEGRLKDNTTVT